MKELRRVKGIGMVDEYGKVIEKCPYKGEKGFKVIWLNWRKIVYSLETQQKLFVLPITTHIKKNKKGIAVPAKHVVSGSAKWMFVNGDLLVYNSLGDFLTSCKIVKLGRKSFKTTSGEDSEYTWKKYNYEAKS